MDTTDTTSTSTLYAAPSDKNPRSLPP